mmetsp:Transcript_8634/g.22197  ORF Transcript_8634/g.22197 Transcript_8634/m.22197 type:complete len:113 (-) Transcript_8634:28-366(-)|eukprot:jgi/Tetstr1/463142/TSEL_008076.t1
MKPSTRSALAIAALLLVVATAPASAAGGMHKGVHQMPKESQEFHRTVEEPEEHPHLKHFYDWKKKYATVGGEAKAFRGKVPEDLIHYMVADQDGKHYVKHELHRPMPQETKK